MEEGLEIANVFTEINEIFKYTSEEVVGRIPEKLLRIIEEKRNKDYDFKCDLTVGLQEQRIMPETKDFIAVIFMNYCCDDEKKKELMVDINENENKKENNLNNIWNNSEDIQSEETTQALAIVEEQGLFERIISKIKSIFGFGRRQARRSFM